MSTVLKSALVFSLWERVGVRDQHAHSSHSPLNSPRHHANTTIIKTLATHREKPFVSVVTPPGTVAHSCRTCSICTAIRITGRPPRTGHPRRLAAKPSAHIDRLTDGTPEAFNIRYIHHQKDCRWAKNATCSMNWQWGNNPLHG